MEKRSEEQILFDMLKEGVSPFYCVKAAKERLKAQGFQDLDYGWI